MEQVSKSSSVYADSMTVLRYLLCEAFTAKSSWASCWNSHCRENEESKGLKLKAKVSHLHPTNSKPNHAVTLCLGSAAGDHAASNRTTSVTRFKRNILGMVACKTDIIKVEVMNQGVLCDSLCNWLLQNRRCASSFSSVPIIQIWAEKHTKAMQRFYYKELNQTFCMHPSISCLCTLIFSKSTKSTPSIQDLHFLLSRHIRMCCELCSAKSWMTTETTFWTQYSKQQKGKVKL